MKKLLLPVAAAAVAALVFLEYQPVPPPATAKLAYGNLPVHFEPTPGDKSFAARGAGFALEFGAQGARVQLARASESAALTLRLEGANPSGARPENLLPGVSNYFLGDDPRAWRTGVPHYERVRYQDVYPGVDLVYYGANGELEYDFLVAPGADPREIRMRYEGAQSVRVDDDGNLRVAVDGGEVVHHRPVSYQVVDGTRQSVDSAFRLLRTAGEAIVSFEIGKYDARLALTIDPVLSYATYLGGTDNNEADPLDGGRWRGRAVCGRPDERHRFSGDGRRGAAGPRRQLRYVHREAQSRRHGVRIRHVPRRHQHRRVAYVAYRCRRKCLPGRADFLRRLPHLRGRRTDGLSAAHRTCSWRN